MRHIELPLSFWLGSWGKVGGGHCQPVLVDFLLLIVFIYLSLCVLVAEIRNLFPSEDGRYTGFSYH